MATVSAVLFVGRGIKELVEVTLVGYLDLAEPATIVRIAVNL